MGLSGSPKVLLRWMVAGPEMVCVVAEFCKGLDKTDVQTRHHKDKPGKTHNELICSMLHLGNFN